MKNVENEDKIPNSDKIRVNNLVNGLKNVLKGTSMEISAVNETVFVKFMQQLITSVDVINECYKINNVSKNWTEQTSYHCEDGGEGSWYYFVDTMDECLGECQRLAIFEAEKGGGQPKRQSELRRIFTRDTFEKSYRAFINQADQNVITKKAYGERLPYGISEEDADLIKKIDGDGKFKLGQSFGRGAAGFAPYLNWHVVSIYYIPTEERIVLGIEKNRYRWLKDMKPLRFSKIADKKDDVAVFYEATKTTLDYDVLYRKFMDVCEEVMMLGLGL